MLNTLSECPNYNKIIPLLLTESLVDLPLKCQLTPGWYNSLHLLSLLHHHPPHLGFCKVASHNVYLEFYHTGNKLFVLFWAFFGTRIHRGEL